MATVESQPYEVREVARDRRGRVPPNRDPRFTRTTRRGAVELWGMWAWILSYGFPHLRPGGLARIFRKAAR